MLFDASSTSLKINGANIVELITTEIPAILNNHIKGAAFFCFAIVPVSLASHVHIIQATSKPPPTADQTAPSKLDEYRYRYYSNLTRVLVRTKERKIAQYDAGGWYR
mmetsp:Transcript_3424/g.5231  ORF Transcript_3424/g.5231 Transcript_3424/m.5231 type:complete len:107 (+) Transcript_3424:236-556(+)